MRILFGLALALIAGSSAPAGAGDPIRIGVVLPFSGVYAALGGDITDGMMLAFETFGDTVAGRKIELIREDSEVKPNVGLSKTKKLVYQDEHCTLRSERLSRAVRGRAPGFPQSRLRRRGRHRRR